MLAITVTPGARGHAELAQLEEPVCAGAELVVEALALLGIAFGFVFT